MTNFPFMTAQVTPVLPAFFDEPTRWLVGVVFLLLVLSLGAIYALRRQPENIVNPAVRRTFELRVRAWCMMFAILVAGLKLGSTGTVVLFGLVSFWALREYITMTPTRPADHKTLFWALFFFTPAQYVLVGWGSHWGSISSDQWYGMFSVLIPVYASLLIPASIAISGDEKRFLERTAKIQVGLLICVYALSYAPAILNLQLFDNKEQEKVWAGSNAGLLFYFVLLVQLGDIFQYGWGKLVGRRVIAPKINSSRTWEGLIGGIATTAMVAALLWKVTPFGFLEAGCMGMVVAIMGFAGGMTMSAIKRDRGVKDYGTLVQGHAGVLDRIDSLCFAAPVFFHLAMHRPFAF